ncbi:MAG: dTMP kinase [Bacilli bacterium]|jgi:dTMP kinase|nr:dTMP kinase [Bacilli bacterium]
MFITMEGGEGSGKSTAIKEIVAELRKEGHEVVLTREPGGTPISEEIRDIILDKKNTAMDPKTEALLYAASRRQHIVEKILPALKAGKIVICDRYLDSSLAYQGGARGIGIDKVYEMNQFATEGLLPDLTILFDIEPKEGLKRIADNAGREVNRLDIERLPFHEKVRASFRKLAKRFPDRYVVIDASKGKKEVLEEAFKAIKDRMG